MNKNTNRVVFSVCFLANILYTIIQTIIEQDHANIFIGIVTTTSLLALYFISMKKHKIMYNGMLDIKQQYHTISQELYNEVSHDYLTKAFSLSAFHEDVAKDHNYNSLAVIDIDNFKSVNDKHGHECGDEVLKLLVSIFQINKIRIYRVGGDEFAVLSNEKPDKLASKLKKLKNDFTDGVEDHYSFRTTISIGIININNSVKDFTKYFSECDRLMYASKAK